MERETLFETGEKVEARFCARRRSIDAHDRADRQIDEQFFRRVARETDAAVRRRIRLHDAFVHPEITAA
jgi:hypothetical protein